MPERTREKQGGAQGSGRAVIGPSGRYQRRGDRSDGARPDAVAPEPHLAAGGVQGLIGTSQPIDCWISMS